MPALWKNIQGVRRIVVETSLVSILTLIVYLVAYWISGKAEIAFAFAAVAAVAVAFAFAFAFAVAFAFAFAAFAFAFAFAAVAVAFAFAFAAVAVAFAFAAVAAVAVAFAFAGKEYNVKYWKALIIYLVEGIALFCAMKFAIPYFAVAVLFAACIVLCFIFAESKLRLWLFANKPPAVEFDEEREEAGSGAYRASDVVVGRYPLPEPLRLRLHRRAYRLYIN